MGLVGFLFYYFPSAILATLLFIALVGLALIAGTIHVLAMVSHDSWNYFFPKSAIDDLHSFAALLWWLFTR